MNANKGNKSNSHRKVSHKLVAEATGAPERTVKAVLNGERSADTELGQAIKVGEILLEDGLNKLVEEVKRVVQIPGRKTKTPPADQ